MISGASLPSACRISGAAAEDWCVLPCDRFPGERLEQQLRLLLKQPVRTGQITTDDHCAILAPRRVLLLSRPGLKVPDQRAAKCPKMQPIGDREASGGIVPTKLRA
jgi:hypothetical protein